MAALNIHPGQAFVQSRKTNGPLRGHFINTASPEPLPRCTFLRRIFRVEVEVQFQHVDPGFSQKSKLAFLGVLMHQFQQLFFGLMPRSLATRGAWNSALAGVMSGSSPEARRSHVIGRNRLARDSRCCAAATSAFTRSTSFWFVGPRLVAPELAASYPFSRGRSARMKISRAGKRLRDDPRTNYLAVSDNQLSVRLVVERAAAPARSPPADTPARAEWL